jgi:RNA-directed DNA polymerase
MNSRSPTASMLACGGMLDQAYTWICTQRLDRGPDNSIWDLRYHWNFLKPQRQTQLSSGQYVLSPMQSYFINDVWISSWTAMDALVLKALALTLQPLFSIKEYMHCTHLKNGGGIHAAIKQVSLHQNNYRHILKSDAYHYYESIDHLVLLTALEQTVSCPVLLDLVSQYCQRLEIKDGNYYHFQRGIPS